MQRLFGIRPEARFCFWVTWGRISVPVFIHRGKTAEADKFPLAPLSGLLDIKEHFYLPVMCHVHRGRPDNLQAVLCFFLINRNSHGSI